MTSPESLEVTLLFDRGNQDNPGMLKHTVTMRHRQLQQLAQHGIKLNLFHANTNDNVLFRFISHVRASIETKPVDIQLNFVIQLVNKFYFLVINCFVVHFFKFYTSCRI